MAEFLDRSLSGKIVRIKEGEFKMWAGSIVGRVATGLYLVTVIVKRVEVELTREQFEPLGWEMPEEA